MSFILDALKKVEQEKRHGSASDGIDARAVSRRSAFGRHPVLSMTAIAIGSAVVTAAVLRGLPERRAPVESVEPVESAESVAPVEDTLVPSVEPPSSERAEAAAKAAVHASRPPSSPSPVERRSPELSREPEPVAAPMDAEPSEETLPEAASHESAEEDVEKAAAPMASAPDREYAPESDIEKESRLPDLVLQGTSVLDGRPVAVISDRRVFEGDRIEGATVVRIGEREVELELGGRSFTLRF